MLSNEYIHNEFNDIIAILNAEDYPETYDFISMLLANDEKEYPSNYDIATALVKCDARLQMHKVVFDLVVELYEAEIENKNADAMNDLGALYYEGHGCVQDFSKAVYYYNMAAEHGNKVAQENLGYCYLYGRDVEVDYEKAFHYFALGAFEGYLVSLYKIGDMYQKGYYVKKNEAEAFRIYERCMDMMTDEAAKLVAGPVYLRLGNAFLYGTGTEPNAKTALICYQNAERFLFDMVNGGDVMYKKSLQAAIDGQTKARELMISNVNMGAITHKVKGPFVLIYFHKNTGRISRTLEADSETELIRFGKENTPKTKECLVFSKTTGEVVFHFIGETQSEIKHNLGNINEYCPGLLEAIKDI